MDGDPREPIATSSTEQCASHDDWPGAGARQQVPRDPRRETDTNGDRDVRGPSLNRRKAAHVLHVQGDEEEQRVEPGFCDHLSSVRRREALDPEGVTFEPAIMMTVTEIQASGEARVAVRISPNVRQEELAVGG